MKLLFKKTWFMSALITGLILLVFFINLLIMSLRLTLPAGDYNLWSLANTLPQDQYINIFAFAFPLIFYTSMMSIIFLGISFLRKNSWGFITAVLYFLGFSALLIIFQSINNYLSGFAIFLTILNIIIIIGIFTLIIFRKKTLKHTSDIVKDEREIKLSQTKIPLSALFLDLISFIVFLTTFFIPLYTMVESGTDYHATIIRVLLFGDTQIEVLIYFLVNFVILLFIFLYSAKCFSYYFFDKEKFIEKSQNLITSTFVATLGFFVTGLSLVMYYTLQGEIVQTASFVPLLLMCVVILVYAILNGKYSTYIQAPPDEIEVKYARVEPLFYVILLTAVTALMLTLKIIKIEITSGFYEYSMSLTGIDIIRDFANLDPGYTMFAFILVVMLISIGLSLVIALTSYLSKYKQFNAIVKSATIVNVFFVFIFAISGYYFQIAKEINQMLILDMFDYYGISLPAGLVYDYTISTDAIYALFVSVSVLTLMFIRKAFDRDEIGLLDTNNLLRSNRIPGSVNDSSSSAIDDDIYEPHDPCPSFTELDLKTNVFKKDLEERKVYKAQKATLNELIHYVVEYARNSRLHLSYTPKDIATFVAGLGASKLSILQGMSGTGKTSLPKIFSEAVYGNCEIIEVESSWKDKNELLGYYNEFSMKYTPKKFTLALYKAALNQEIFTFILLDEMNLSRIEYYFSDFLSLMENEEDQREIKLININLHRKEKEKNVDYLALDYGHTLNVPSNVWFVGTANRDESTFVISDKVYDRAHTMDFTKRAPKVRNYLDPIPKKYYDYQTINELFVTAKEKGDFDAEESKLIKNVEALLAPYNISFGNRILKQIEDFVNIYKECFPSEDVESEAIEKILLSKVVAKLEVKTIEDKEKLEIEFEKLNLNQCAEFVRRLDDE